MIAALFLYRPALAWVSAGHIAEDRAHRGDHGGEHRHLVGEAAAADAVVAFGRVLRRMLQRVVVRSVHVETVYLTFESSRMISCW